MNESAFEKLAGETFRAIGDAFENVDTDAVDCEIAGDVVTLTMRGGGKCIVNTQRPTRQIWLAASAHAWHFSWDDATRRWLDDKGRGDELFATLARIVKQSTGAEIPLS